MTITSLGTGLFTTLNLSVPPATVSGNGQYHVALLTLAISGRFWLLRGEGEEAERQLLGGRARIQTQICN